AGQIVDLRVKLGDQVRKGQPLCAINSREVAAALAEHSESHKDLDLADKTLAMTQDLFDHEAASRIALQQAQNDLAKAHARVARDLRFVSVGQKAAIAAAAYPGERFAARVDYVSNTIDPATRTAKVRLSVPNPAGRLKPEMFASVTVGLAETERVLTVPSRAV